MSIRISLNLSNRDLRFFREAVRRARDAVRVADEDEIIEAIRVVIRDIRSNGPLPDFIATRMPALQALTDMLDDLDWQLPARERERLLAAFVYFCDPEDLIPDDIPVIGFLDDVVIIELLMREMRHVSDAYADFIAFRQRLPLELGKPERVRRLTMRRRQLHERMRRRYAAANRHGTRSSLW